MLTLLLRLRDEGGITKLDEELLRFKRNHHFDSAQDLNVELLVERFESSAEWCALWCSDRGEAARLALVHALSSLVLCAVPSQLVIVSRAFRLTVVVRKQIALSDVPHSEGWEAGPATFPPSGSKGHHGWTFRRQQPHPTEDEAEGASPLPHVSLYDLLAQCIRWRPAARAAALNVALCLGALLAAASAYSRGLTLFAWVWCAPAACLQFMHCATYLRDVHRTPVVPRYGTAVVVAAILVAIIGALVGSTLWLMVQWSDYWAGPAPAPATTSELCTAGLRSSWAIYLADGEVDTSRVISQHRTCHKAKKLPPPHSWPCNFVYAAPIVAGAGDRAPIAAWAVATSAVLGGPPHTVRCTRRGGLCGLAAQHVLWPETLERLRRLIAAQASEGAEAPHDPALLLVLNPDTYLASEPSSASFASAALVLLFAANLVPCWSAAARPARSVGRDSEDLRDEPFAGQALLSEAWPEGANVVRERAASDEEEDDRGCDAE